MSWGHKPGNLHFWYGKKDDKQYRWQSGEDQGKKEVLFLGMKTVTIWKVIKRSEATRWEWMEGWTMVSYIPFNFEILCFCGLQKSWLWLTFTYLKEHILLSTVEILWQNFFFNHFLNLCYSNDLPRSKLKVKAILSSTALDSTWKYFMHLHLKINFQSDSTNNLRENALWRERVLGQETAVLMLTPPFHLASVGTLIPQYLFWASVWSFGKLKTKKLRLVMLGFNCKTQNWLKDVIVFYILHTVTQI